MDVTLYRLSIAFTVVAGTGAAVLAALAWSILRGSPFETTSKLLATIMAIATAYHGGLIVAGSETVALEVLLVIGYALVPIALFVALRDLKRGAGSGAWDAGAIGSRYVFLAATAGLFLFVVGGTVSEAFVPAVHHWVHGVAALFAVAGLYGPIRGDLRNGPWNELLLEDAIDGRRDVEWMVPMDDAVLEVLHSSGLVLTPAVVAYNLEYSREEVNRRLRELESTGFVERPDRGKYRLAERGARYLRGEPPEAA